MARVTVEDCLVSQPNRFALVLMTVQRAKQLKKGKKALVKSSGNKEIVTALREIASDLIQFVQRPEISSEIEVIEEPSIPETV